MKFCERKHKPTKYEETVPLSTLRGAGVGEHCGGAIEAVMSADGKRQYGERCSACGHVTTMCQVCERMFVNIARHLTDKDGNPTACYEGNPEYRRMRAIEDNAKGRPK